MKGTGRSLIYWQLNLQKIFWAMMATIAVVSFLMGTGDGMSIQEMLNMYLLMGGGIFVVATMMTASNCYIPQSLSMGATRKETFLGMELSLHLMLLQLLLLALLVNAIAPQAIWSGEYLRAAVTCYLACMALGNILCTFGLRFGGHVAMIFYVVMVVVFAMGGGVSAALMGRTANLDVIMSNIIKGWIVALIFDILTGVICYLAFRRYAVRA